MLLVYRDPNYISLVFYNEITQQFTGMYNIKILDWNADNHISYGRIVFLISYFNVI